MPKISQLSQHLVNKIAAGEVIERPASVIKELVENAIDAGATRIDIAIEDGGKKLIQVTDDGGGMERDDAALAFAPHATSKLRDEDGLFNICTMGFRGEALASIASISHAHIRTRRRKDANGWEISASGENITAVTPCPAAAGTTITVRDLFFNTPARRKFLKTASTEFGHITEQVARLSLPHPQISFTVRHNGRETVNLPACQSTLQRITDLFTPDTAENLIPIPQRNAITTINGLIGTPAAARNSTKWQYVFLNGRYIRDRLISHAIKEAYRGRIMPAKCPVAFIFINIDPHEVDVNVHPTKIEVRFRNSNGVYGDVLAALKETLSHSNLAPDMQTQNFFD
ncbi:MAG TPA: DNA mismatch repair endonuclease MutL, partial [Phycisphaerae bacterium]|nr:DNA mismatch repair endonuclease MutL [Phycisphaerae bacterium]